MGAVMSIRLKWLCFSLLVVSLVSFPLHISSVLHADDLPTPIASTLVKQALHDSLNDEGKWTQIQFSDDTTQTTAGVGSGDVSKVGTPVDNQIGVWTGDGTIEGTAGLSYDGLNFLVTGDIGSIGARITKGWFTDVDVDGDIKISNGNSLILRTDAIRIHSHNANELNHESIGANGTIFFDATNDVIFRDEADNERMRFEMDTGNVGIDITNPTSRLHLPLENDPVTPTLSFGDGNDGFFNQTDGIIGVAISGAGQWLFEGNSIRSFQANGLRLTSGTANATTPNILPHRQDTDTGIGYFGPDAFSFIAGGVEGHRVTESGGNITHNMTGMVGVGIDPTTASHVDSNAADTVAIETIENTGGDIQRFIGNGDPEGVVTGSIGDGYTDHTNGIAYIKNSGSASNTGWVVTGGTPVFKSYSLSNPGSSGTFYVGGHYGFAAADATLTIGGTVIQTFGSAGQAHGTHAFCVASGAGGTDLVLTVTGISITDVGVRNASDTEIIVADTDAAITDQYFETTKKWLGQITYTLTGSSGAFTFNYGMVKYEDFGNRNFTITEFEGTGEARANETGLNIELLHHEATAFVYDASAFIPNQTALVSLATDYSTDNDVANGDGFAYRRTGLTTAVSGSGSEGLMIRVTTVVNNSINDATFHIGVLLR